jgi:tetratricopeptide (TPR) repeat protein
MNAMKTNRVANFLVAASLTVVNGYTQTAAEQMQKGIYTQETAGDLDGAIAIYRQIVDSGSSPRDLAAEAQYRLAQSLLQKGDLSNAAQEFEKLARSYADYGKLVSSLASMARGNTAPITIYGGRGGRGAPAGASSLSEQQMADMAKLAAKLADLESVQSAPDAGLTQEQQAADRAKKLATFQAELARLDQEMRARAAAGGGRSGVSPADANLTAPPPGTIRVGSAVQAANLISQTPPVYPPLAKAARVQGTVRFDATIGKDGHVENLQLISGPPLLVQAAMQSVSQSVYKPVLLNGQPVPVITTVDVNFTLTE